MTAQQYRDRAQACEAKAALSPSLDLRAQYLELVAHWRLLSVEAVYSGQRSRALAAALGA